MGNILISGLVNLETTVKVSGFPLGYTPICYDFFGIDTAVSGVGVNLAKALIGARRESEAIDVLLALLAEGHEVGDLSAVVTALLLKRGRFHEALHWADQAVQHDQGNPAKQLLKSRALAALQRYNEANYEYR